MTGASHSSVKRYRELARHSPKNGLERELLLDGPHLLFEARKSGLPIESAAFDHNALADSSIRTLAEQLVADGADVFIVSRKTLETMSPVRTPAGAVGIARRTLPSLADALSSAHALVVVAHDVQDPGNVGGIMRTAEAAGATAFVTTAATADPLGWKALRGSMGSALRLPIARGEMTDVLQALRSAGIQTVALVPRDRPAVVRCEFQDSIGTDSRERRPGLAGRSASAGRSARDDSHAGTRRIAERRRRRRARVVRSISPEKRR